MEELDGLVWGRTKMPIKGAQPAPDLHTVAIKAERERVAAGEPVKWWDNPWPLGIAVLTVMVILNIVVG